MVIIFEKRKAIIARLFERESLTFAQLKRRLPSVTEDEVSELCRENILELKGETYSITEAGLKLSEADRTAQNKRTLKRGLLSVLILALAYIIVNFWLYR